MKVTVVSPVRLFRECIAVSLESMQPRLVLATEASVSALLGCAPGEQPEVALVDVTLGVDLEEVGLLAAKWTAMPLLALGLLERRDEVIHLGRAGFAGYIARDASMSDLQSAITDAVAGRLRCPAEITGGLIRALFDRTQPPTPIDDKRLTRRETDVLHMLGRGLSNKEIARELSLSVATIKSHVHNVLGKLGVAHRAQAMRQMRATPWLGQN